jgi:hypothetical protein
MLSASAFVDAAKHNYQLTATSPANDAGVTLLEVTTDRDGGKRPQGSGYDVGAYERAVSGTNPDPGGSAEVVLHATEVCRGSTRILRSPLVLMDAGLQATDQRGRHGSHRRPKSGAAGGTGRSAGPLANGNRHTQAGNEPAPFVCDGFYSPDRAKRGPGSSRLQLNIQGLLCGLRELREIWSAVAMRR